MHKKETCFKIKNKAKLQNNYYNSRLFILFIYLDYFYFPELSLLHPWKRHSFMLATCETASWTIYLYFTSDLLLHRVSGFSSTFFFEWSYLNKIIASVICDIPGKIDTISDCDYLCLKSIPTKNPAEISNVTIIHPKRHKQKASSSPDSSNNHSQETHISRKINKWTIYPIWSMVSSVIKVDYHLHICFSIYKHIWNTKCWNVQIDNCFSEDTVGVKRKHIFDT